LLDLSLRDKTSGPSEVKNEIPVDFEEIKNFSLVLYNFSPAGTDAAQGFSLEAMNRIIKT